MVKAYLQRFSQLDHEVSARFASLVRKPWARMLALALAHSGDSFLWLLLGLAFSVLTQGWWQVAGIRIVAITLLTGGVSALLKALIRRSRPTSNRQGLYMASDRHAFPSGHATRVGGLMVALGSTLPLPSALGLGVWALAVCASRVALGAHFVGDVSGGLLLGGLLSLLFL